MKFLNFMYIDILPNSSRGLYISVKVNILSGLEISRNGRYSPSKCLFQVAFRLKDLKEQ